jgi:hypothetical protein
VEEEKKEEEEEPENDLEFQGSAAAATAAASSNRGGQGMLERLSSREDWINQSCDLQTDRGQEQLSNTRRAYVSVIGNIPES